MKHGHGHGHSGGPSSGGPSGHAAGRASDRSRLRRVLVVTSVVLVVELVGAWLTGSLALLADAGHMATDAGAVVLALGASYVAGLRGGPARPSATTEPRSSPRCSTCSCCWASVATSA